MKTSVMVCSLVGIFFATIPLSVGAAPDVVAEPQASASAAVSVSDLSHADLRAKYDVVQGKQTYERVCITCHSDGVMEAPKFCDITAWKPRIAHGMESMVKHAVEGFNNMPSKGGMESLSVAEAANAVAYMVDQCLLH